jgi:UDP-N-acetylglucosamine:LPS N-acetylglucosamine transferase
LAHFRKKAKTVPLIVRKNIQHKKIASDDSFKVLIMDSGSRVLEQSIQKALNDINNLKDFHFFVSSAFQCEHDNVTFIDKNELFVDYICEMDLVIGRAGFNTISECIALRTPMLLLSEGMNPEMNENIINVKHEGFGSFMSSNQFADELNKYLPQFVRSEYKIILERMKSHTVDSDGAKVIAEDILNKVLTRK